MNWSPPPSSSTSNTMPAFARSWSADRSSSRPSRFRIASSSLSYVTFASVAESFVSPR